MDRFEQLPDSEKIERYARLAQKALSAYGLSDVGFAHLQTSTHATFEVTTGDPSRHYALRICRAEWPYDMLQREILWLTSLCRDTDLVVPEPMLSTDGQLIRKVAIAGVPGFRLCTLLRWVDGEQRNSELTAENLNRIGSTLATLHAHATTFRWPDEIEPSRRDATHVSQTLNEDSLLSLFTETQIDTIRQAIAWIGRTMVELGSGSAVAGAIHGRFTPSHLRFANGDAHAIGFGHCRWGYYLYDIATLRRHVVSRENGVALVAALLDGYRSVRALPDDTENRIPAFSALQSIDRIRSLLSESDLTGRASRNLDREHAVLQSLIETI